MPINFDLSPFAKISSCFCETGTFEGSGVLKALDAGFSNIATVEISEKNQLIAKGRVQERGGLYNTNVKFILGDAEKHISTLIEFAKQCCTESEPPVFWLDAHTHIFKDGSPSGGNPCPLMTEIKEIVTAFKGKAVVLVDDMRIIGLGPQAPKTLRNRLRAAAYALLCPQQLIGMLTPGWGKDVNLLSLLQAAARPGDICFKLLDGHTELDVLCIYPGDLHSKIVASRR